MTTDHRTDTRDGRVQLIHEEAARYDPWIVAILAGALVLPLALGFLLFRVAPSAIWFMMGITIFEGVVFHAVCPRRYQIFTDRLKIVLGWPFSFEIPLETIADARPGPPGMALAYFGFRFSPSTKTVVEITRRGHWNVVVSPVDRERFLERLAQAIEVAERSR